MTYWIKRLIFVALLLPIAACQAQSEKYQAGVHYQVLPQAVRTANSSKIEVNEVFSYHCGHCFTFENVLHPWSGKLAEDIDFQRTPAVWAPQLEPFARAYYAAAVLKSLEQLHMPFFEAIHVKRTIQLTRGATPSVEDFAKIVEAKGLDRAKFVSAYNSFGVSSQVNQAKARIRGYMTRGTPEMIVNGKYRVALEFAQTFEGMLSVAEFLIEKERQAMAAQ